MFADLAWLEFFRAITSFLVHSFNLFAVLRCLQSATVLLCSFLELNALRRVTFGKNASRVLFHGLSEFTNCTGTNSAKIVLL